MFIEKLVLRGYIRLMVRNIVSFTYTPTSPYQLILGTNGTGKSSVMYELSPLPADPKNYDNNGFKEITLTHGSSRYVLTSARGKSGWKHSFLKDDVEHNDGGTITIQRDIVRREFGLYTELHELLLGERKLTRMGPAERREWIAQLSSADYTYALGRFEHLSTRARDAKGALKHLNERLTNEVSNLSQLGSVGGLEEQSTALRDELNLLFTSRTPGLEGLSKAEFALEELLNRIDSIGTAVITTVPYNPPGKHYRSQQDVQNDLTRIASDTQTSQALLTHYTSEYGELDQILSAMQGADGQVTDLDVRIKDYEQAIAQLTSGIEFFHDIQDPDGVQQDVNAVIQQLGELFTQLPNNVDRVYTKDTAATAQKELDHWQRGIDSAKNKIANCEAKISRLKEAKEIECPSCHHVWRDGFNAQQFADLNRWIEENHQSLENCEREVAKRVEFLEVSEEYSLMYQRFRQLMASYPRMKPLWDYVMENRCYLDHPKSHIPMFYTFQRDVNRWCEIKHMSSDLEHIQLLAKRGALGDDKGVAHLQVRLSKLTQGIEQATQQIRALTVENATVKKFNDHVVVFGNRVEDLRKDSWMVDLTVQAVVNNLRNQAIDGVVATHQNSLAIMQQRLNAKSAMEGIVNDLSNDQCNVSLDFEAYKALLNELSPKDGLIAEQLMGFIKCLTEQMNSIIASVWTYDLSVLPCGNDSDELDYKFPLQDSPDHTSADVSKASTGQQDMVDFAFKMTVILYLGLGDFPLYLDELGASFDEQHRTNVMNFVKQLMDTGYHQQVFMVSHYASSHGAFSNAEVLVMDDRNIVVPKEHNKHVVMA